VTSAGRIPRMDALGGLLDKQVVDRDGRMVGKVDDLEMEERDDGRLVVTALLVGPGAWGPRIGGGTGSIVVRTWSRLSGRSRQDRDRIEYADVAGIDSAVHLGVVRSAGPAEAGARTRIIDALPGSGKDPDG
jgi:sporulation protein YlmC with PRC-barrel domain